MLTAIKRIIGFSGAAAEEAAKDVDAMLASKFPNVYSTAAYNTLVAEKAQWNRKLTEAEARVKREETDVTRVESKIAEITAATGEGGAYSRQAYDGAKDDAAKKSIMDAANRLRSEKERLDAQLVKEREDVNLAKSRLERIQRIYEKFVENLSNFAAQSQAMKDKLAESKDRQAEAKMRADEAKAMDGITGAFSGLQNAMDGMNRAAEVADKEARMAEREAEEATASSGSSIDQLLASAKTKPSEVRKDPWAA